MKKTVICALITGILLLTGCGKASSNSTDNNKASSSITDVQNDSKNKTGAAKDSASDKQQSNNAASVIKNAPAGKTPQLSSSKKTQINNKVVNALNSVDNVLNSLPEAKDINLNGM